VSVEEIPRIAAPEGITIRAARPSDAASFREMWVGVVAEQRYVRTAEVTRTTRSFKKGFRNAVTDDVANLMAVDASGRVVGNLYIERERHPVNHHVATLGMAIAPEWRGKGLGSALMSEALRWAERVGIEKVALSVYPGNAAAQALYRKFGFEEEGVLRRQSKKPYGYEDEVVMARFLR
jgi:putative acetyltransferase